MFSTFPSVTKQFASQAYVFGLRDQRVRDEVTFDELASAFQDLSIAPKRSYCKDGITYGFACDSILSLSPLRASNLLLEAPCWVSNVAQGFFDVGEWSTDRLGRFQEDFRTTFTPPSPRFSPLVGSTSIVMEGVTVPGMDTEHLFTPPVHSTTHRPASPGSSFNYTLPRIQISPTSPELSGSSDAILATMDPFRSFVAGASVPVTPTRVTESSQPHPFNSEEYPNAGEIIFLPEPFAIPPFSLPQWLDVGRLGEDL
ncbi:hypothetical protein EW146_g1496 [Bondarzewia mesenterica]|uniref:Uncharacterized protein n=1 Tax=Bondarzewia mesenterica TaxID=1095465 RepID=A0A4S4M3R9_9AGAM|nr:hypothetical protein EW146_g1496 [Bondarzewia mesenterica]